MKRNEKMVELGVSFHAHARQAGRNSGRREDRGILESLGYKVLVGREMLDLESVMGHPSKRKSTGIFKRALTRSRPAWIERMGGSPCGAFSYRNPGCCCVPVRYRCGGRVRARDEKHRPFRTLSYMTRDHARLRSCAMRQ